MARERQTGSRESLGTRLNGKLAMFIYFYVASFTARVLTLAVKLVKTSLPAFVTRTDERLEKFSMAREVRAINSF